MPFHSEALIDMHVSAIFAALLTPTKRTPDQFPRSIRPRTTRAKEYRVLLPFFKEGLKSKEKNVHTVDPRLRDDHHQRLTLAGVDVKAVFESGQFELRDWSDTHLAGGNFDQHRTLALFRQIAIGRFDQDGRYVRNLACRRHWGQLRERKGLPWRSNPRCMW
jgi:hypothetical protein